MARRGDNISDRHRQQRGKNYAVLVMLVGFCVIFYLVYIARGGLL
jgi:hypothetical protein